jgi:glycolate oxidase iron-sulfur subunit
VTWPAPPIATILNPADFIKHEAAKCVACGLCLPHCPTYKLLHDEAESPRGRLSLMLALAQGDLALSARMETHLAHCLACRACERVCPSYVPYGQILDAGRALIEQSRGADAPSRSRAVAGLMRLIKKPERINALGKLLRLYQRSGLQRILRAARVPGWFGLGDLEANLPALSPQKPLARSYPARGESRGRVMFFTGCLARITDRQTLDAAIRLLNRIGYEVRVPEQGCCGALHLHSGQSRGATGLMRQTVRAFAGATDTILSTASGCTATLCEYGKYLPGERAAEEFSRRVMDINQFLASLPWPSNVSFRPLAKRIAVHSPCTLSNVLHQDDKPFSLLKRIPGAEVIPLPDNAVCCGAAGTYHLTEPRIARELRAPKIEHLKQLAPDILVTSNPGCAMFLAAGMREAGLRMEVIHPVVLLEKQLQVTSIK